MTSSSCRGGYDPYDYPMRKLVIVGDATCGKTSLLWAFTHTSSDQFCETHVPIIFDTLKVDVKVRPDKVILLSMMDTAGRKDLARHRGLCYPDSHVILLCFAMDSWESFNSVRDSWYPEVRQNCPNAPLLLVGCKSDLAGSWDSRITAEAVQKLATDIGAEGHFLCSARTLENVTDLCETAGRLAYKTGKRRSPLLTGCFGQN